MRYLIKSVAISIFVVSIIESALADQVLKCTISGQGFPPPTQLTIKGTPQKPSHILWPSSSYMKTYKIDAMSEVHYAATEENPESEDSASRIFINRLTGQLQLENFVSHVARQVLVRRCDGQIDYDQCSKEQKTIKGGNPFACSGPERDRFRCARWRNGHNLIAFFVYDCEISQRRF